MPVNVSPRPRHGGGAPIEMLLLRVGCKDSLMQQFVGARRLADFEIEFGQAERFVRIAAGRKPEFGSMVRKGLRVDWDGLVVPRGGAFPPVPGVSGVSRVGTDARQL